MRIIINGVCGRMGSELLNIIRSGYCGSEFAAGVDINVTADMGEGFFTSLEEVKNEADCIIDFSHHTCTASILKYAVEKNLPVVLCTTGHTEEELKVVEATANKIPIFKSANMSLGIALLVELAKLAAKTMPGADIEIVEKHHNRKLDAPSGTALLLADEIKTVRENANYVLGRSGMGKREPNDIGIHAVRMGNIVGEHEVLIGTDTQTITLKHECHSRNVFAEGAVNAAAFLVNQKPGIYDMNDMVKDQK